MTSQARHCQDRPPSAHALKSSAAQSQEKRPISGKIDAPATTLSEMISGGKFGVKPARSADDRP
jgi:hypothetical protein